MAGYANQIKYKFVPDGGIFDVSHKKKKTNPSRTEYKKYKIRHYAGLPILSKSSDEAFSSFAFPLAHLYLTSLQVYNIIGLTICQCF